MIENVLPEGWTDVSIDDCSNILDNLRIPINSTERSKRIGDVPYYGATGQVGWINDFIFNEELVLLGEDAAPFFDKTKNVAFLIRGKSWVNNHAHVLKGKDEIILNSYLLHYLNYFDYTDFVGGTTRLKLTQGDLKKIPVLLPPLAEQKRIVAKLDEAFQYLDTLKVKLDRIPTILKNFRQAVLTQAISGKLTEKWRVENSIPTTLDLYNEIRDRIKSTSKRTTILEADSEEAPFEIPFEWLFINLGELSEKLTYGTSTKSEDTGEVPVLRMGNLQKGRIDWTDLKFTADKIEIEKYALKKGDVLFNRTNSPELVGKTSIYESDEPAIYAGYLIKIWNYPELNSYYLNYALNSMYAKRWAQVVKSDGVSQSNINAQKLADFLVPLPSEEEQKEIVRRVETLFAKADAIEASYETLKGKIDKLPQALLAKAFRGELVTQNPEDEPASVLLEIIKGKMIEEENAKKVKKNMKVKKTDTAKKPLLNIVQDEFADKTFTFDELREKVETDYSSLKEELFLILDKGNLLTMNFDESKQVMSFKLVHNENSKD